MVNIDKGLFKRVNKGDIGAFEILFKKYYQELCHYATKYVKDMDTAEEIIQDLYYTIWEKRTELDIKTSVKSYLYRAVFNKSIQFNKHKAIEKKYESYTKANMNAYEPDASEEIGVKELNEKISSTLTKLPERCRTIFTMSRFEGFKYHEIAEKLAISIKTVEANIGKALKLFRKDLSEYTELVES